MGIEKFTATINREGSTGSVRGKIPASLISAIGAKEGDVVEFHVNRGTLVGGHVMTGKEARQFRAQGRQSFGGSAPKSSGNGKAKKKVVGKAASSEKAQKSGKKAGKSSKNKTSVKVSKSKVKGKKGRVKPRFSL